MKIFLLLFALALPAQAHRSGLDGLQQGCGFSVAAGEDSRQLIARFLEQNPLPSAEQLGRLAVLVRGIQKSDRSLASLFQAGNVPVPGSDSAWTQALVFERIRAYRTQTLEALRPLELRRRRGQDAAYHGMRAAGFTLLEVANLFTEQKLNGVEWNRGILERRYVDDPGLFELLFRTAAAKDDFSADELFALASQLRRTPSKGTSAEALLRREGIPPPAGFAEWDAAALLSLYAAKADAAYPLADRKLLTIRSSLLEAIAAYSAAGLNVSEIAHLLTNWNVPAPKGEQWTERSVRSLRQRSVEEEGTTPRVSSSHYPWRPTAPDFAARADALLGSGVHDTETVRKKIVWMRWHGLLLEDIAKKLNEKNIRTARQREPWQASRVHESLAAAERLVLSALRGRSGARDVLHVMQELDGIVYSPEQIAAYLNAHHLAPSAEVPWTAVSVSTALVSASRRQPPDTSPGTDGGRALFRWRGTRGDVAEESLPTGSTNYRQAQLAALWLRWHGYSLPQIAEVFERRGVRLDRQKSPWTAHSVNSAIGAARNEVFFQLASLDRATPEHAEIAIRRLDAAAVTPLQIARTISNYGILQPDGSDWTADQVIAVLLRPNSPLFQVGTFPTLDPIGLPPWGKRTQPPWRPRRREDVWENEGPQFLATGEKRVDRIRRAIATLHWYGFSAHAIAHRLRARQIIVPGTATSGWDAPLVSVMLGDNRQLLVASARALDRRRLESSDTAITLLDRARLRPEAIVTFLRREQFPHRTGEAWTTPDVIAVLHRGEFPWRSKEREYSLRGGDSLLPEKFESRTLAARYAGWLRWHGFSVGRIETLLRERGALHFGSGRELLVQAQADALAELQRIRISRRNAAWIFARRLDQVNISPQEIADYLQERFVPGAENGAWSSAQVIEILHQRALPGYSYLPTFDDAAAAARLLAEARTVADRLELVRQDNIRAGQDREFAMPVLDTHEERVLLSAIHLLRHIAANRAYRLGPTAQLEPRQIPEIEALFALADRFRGVAADANARLVQHEMPAVLPSGYTNADMLQIGMIAVLNSIDAFDLARHLKLSTLITTSVRNIFHRHWSGQFTLKQRVNTVAQSADVADADGEPLSAKLEARSDKARYVPSDYNWDVLQASLRSLSVRQRRVLAFSFGLRGQPFLADDQIAAYLRIPEDDVREARREALAILAASVSDPFSDEGDE